MAVYAVRVNKILIIAAYFILAACKEVK